jgi:hypothetical protein
VQTGIQNAINGNTAEAFWNAGLKVLRNNAAEHTGRFVLGSLWSLLSKVGTFMLLGGVVYALGGWSALSTLAKAIFATSTT